MATGNDKILHSEDCRRVWKRYDLSCARCCQLAGGAPARSGWFDKRADERRGTIPD